MRDHYAYLHDQFNKPTINWQSDSELDDSSEESYKLKVRAIFISDLHLGTPGCQAPALLDFLKTYSSDQLYLVGDIVDGWQLRRRWYWPQSHNDVIQKLLRKVRKGCKVVYVPGNHDEFAREFLGHSFGGIEIVEEAVHETIDGRKFWVIHGDYFDGVIQCAKWLAYVGDNLYELTLKLNRYLTSLRTRFGLLTGRSLSTLNIKLRQQSITCSRLNKQLRLKRTDEGSMALSADISIMLRSVTSMGSLIVMMVIGLKV